MEILEKLKRLLNWLERYKNETNCRGVVLGVSGGKDSTIVAMLAKKIWGKNVFGVLMPNGNQKDIKDSIDICEQLEIHYSKVNIGSAIKALSNEIEAQACKISEKSQTNIPPRIRMATLYAIAQSLGYRVIGTSNASERYIGWSTKWGDSVSDVNPIGNLTCTEVVEMGKILAKEFGLDEKFVSKKPSDGLTGKSDEENFGFSYEELDNWILFGEGVSKEVADKIEEMHKYSEHKREMPPIFVI